MIISRRGVIGGLLGLVAAPAVVHAINLMPISVFKEPLRLASGEGCPAGWLRCDGGFIRRADYPELFAAIGNTYGGDGTSLFAVPRLTPEVSRLFDTEIVTAINAKDDAAYCWARHERTPIGHAQMVLVGGAQDWHSRSGFGAYTSSEDRELPTNQITWLE